jgi:hypothetical protein
MNRHSRFLLACCSLLLALAVTIAAQARDAEIPGDPTIKFITLNCTKLWRGSAGGTYGGKPFSVSCQSNRDQQLLTGVAGTDYAIRMGAENGAVGAFDCFWSGSQDSLIVHCGSVRLAIH